MFQRVCFLKWTVRWYCAYRIWYCTCVDIVTDALHGDGRISNSSTLQVPHYAFDPTMHLHATSTISSQAFANPVPNFPHQHLLHNLSQWMLHDVMVWCIIHDDQFNSEIRFHICPFEPDSIFKYKLCPRVGQAPLKSTSVLRKQHNSFTFLLKVWVRMWHVLIKFRGKVLCITLYCTFQLIKFVCFFFLLLLSIYTNKNIQIY